MPNSPLSWMNSFRHPIFSLFFLIYPACVYGESTLDEIPKAIENLSSADTNQIISSLEMMGRICDESCVPYIADMLRHDDPKIVQSACKTALALANPRLEPALRDVLYHHPVEEVRAEALRALTRVGSNYDAFLQAINPAAPDELQERILRNLPENLLETKSLQYAEYAQTHAFSTSVAAAYHHHPELLMSALTSILPDSKGESRNNIYRTMALIAPLLKEDFATPEIAQIFWDEADINYDSISIIEASRLTPDALNWLVSHLSQLTDAELLNVIYSLNPNRAEVFYKAILQVPEHAERFIQNKQLRERLPNSIQSQIQSTETANSPSFIEKFFDAKESISAMHQASAQPEYLPMLISQVLQSPQIDDMNPSYLARWAIVMMLSQNPKLKETEDLSALRADALEIVKDSRRLHAEPALALLRQLGATPTPPPVSTFVSLRTDMKCAWLKVLSPEAALPYLEPALRDQDEATITCTLEIAPEAGFNPENLCEFIDHKAAIVSIQAAKTAVQLSRTDCLATLEKHLTDADTRIAYQSLWAMQKLHALPPAHLLKSLYYRAADGFLRDRLGFLTGLGKTIQENRQLSELTTQRKLHPGQIFQLQTDSQPQGKQEITIIHEDQSLQILRTNSFGMIQLAM